MRIKLSELCYKSIACDVTEDKKHIDLSSEPLILVCGAGLVGSTADDIAKEVAIYRAHKAAPDRHRLRRRGALPRRAAGHQRAGGRARAGLRAVGHGRPPVRLRSRAGHRRAGPAAARGPRGDRAVDRAPRVRATRCSGGCGARTEPIAERFWATLRTGSYDGHLEASTAVRLTSLLRYAAGAAPLEVYQAEFGVIGTPEVLVDDLTAALTRGIEELTRPVDAIKHQAKTVTVGISRSDESLLGSRLVQEVLERRRRSRPPQLPHAEGPRRARSGRRRRQRLHALRHRGRCRERRGPHLHRRSWRAVPRRGVAGRAQPRAARHEAPRRQRPRGAGRTRPRRRPHGRCSCPR